MPKCEYTPTWAKEMPPVEPVTRMRDAHFAHCPECDMWMGCQYWPLQKSIALHAQGTGHLITYYRMVSDAA